MTTIMIPQKIEANVYDLNYPLFVVPFRQEQREIVHIPGQFEFANLDASTNCTLQAYKEDGIYYVYDAIPVELWHKKICKTAFHERRKTVLNIVYGTIAKPSKVQEATCVEIDNPIELIDYCDNLLTQGYKKVRLFDRNGEYVFGPTINFECLELDL